MMKSKVVATVHSFGVNIVLMIHHHFEKKKRLQNQACI
jgi:hypothetical protein